MTLGKNFYKKETERLSHIFSEYGDVVFLYCWDEGFSVTIRNKDLSKEARDGINVLHNLLNLVPEYLFLKRYSLDMSGIEFECVKHYRYDHAI